MTPAVRALAVLALLLLVVSANAKKLKSPVTRDHMKVRMRTSALAPVLQAPRPIKTAAEVVRCSR